MIGPGPDPQVIDPIYSVANTPINSSLLRWWVGLPNVSAGSAYRDIVGRGSSGTLTGNPNWCAAQSQLLFGARVTGGTSLSIPIPAKSFPWYISFWIYVDVYTGGFWAVLDDSARQFSAFYDTSGNLSFGNWNLGNIPLGRWTHCVEAVNADGAIFTWNNGTPVTVGLGGGANASATALEFGANPSTGGSTSTARYADIRFGADVPDVAALYREGLLSYPTGLRRLVPGVRWAVTPTAPSGPVTWRLKPNPQSATVWEVYP